jgi:type IV pilus assembly protein PilY1
MMGDPLHSQPSLIRYRVSSTVSMRVFVGTNHGFLHSINTNTGAEAWAFVPKDLLPNITVLRNNAEGVKKVYGLDGSVSAYLVDANKDGVVDVGTDQAYLMIGMRRGGNRYYVMDVSSPDAPKLMHVIDGAITGFENLSQTWSNPVIGKMKVGSTTSLVAVFGGGYDPDQDLDGAPIVDDQGNAVYIVDLLTGAKLWDSTQLGMTTPMNSVPADVRVIDVNGDGLLDTLYAVDTAAQVFRFDVFPDGTIKGGRLAHLQPASASRNDNRRFYAGISVALVPTKDGSQFLAVSVGTGFREKPLETGQYNHFYSIRDYGVFSRTITKDVTLSDLADVTTLVGDTDADGISDASEAITDQATGARLKEGWYIKLESALGEKVMASGVVLNFKLYFSTYLPPSGASTSCDGAKGSSRSYVVDLLDGTPVKNDGNLDPTDRYDQMDGIAGFLPTQLIFTENGVLTAYGTELGDAGSGVSRMTRTKWRHNTN